MSEGGVGGFFMHARGGCTTEYMSNEWFDAIKAGIEEARQLGIDAYIYDENGWPSGFAGGKVVEKNKNFCVKWLKSIIINSLSEAQSVKNIIGFYDTVNGTELKSDDNITFPRCAVYYMESCDYADILNPEAVKYFIDSTHEKYKELFGDGFKGFFTDEPQFGVKQCPHSKYIEEEYVARYGEDYKKFLGLLFINGEGFKEFRYRYYDIANCLLVNNYYKQIYDWCDKNGYILTGHGYDENSLSGQMESSGDLMAAMDYMHYPGLDWLGREIGKNFIPRQISSIAKQTGKKRVLSEMFSLTSWSITPAQLKNIAEWMYFNGVDLTCQHLMAYSLQGNRKRDYPPSLFIHQPWWPNMKIFNDYCDKLAALISQSERLCDILVFSPVKSAYCYWNGFRNNDCEIIERNFENVCQKLDDAVIDYDIGSECILKKYGKVNKNTFIIGECSYKTIILSDLMNLDKETFDFIKEFSAGGGEIVIESRAPFMLEGHKSSEVETFFQKIETVSLNLIISAKKQKLFDNTNNLRIFKRRYEDMEYYYLINTEDKITTIKVTDTFERYDLNDFSSLLLPEKEIRFQPFESMLLMESRQKNNEIDKIYSVVNNDGNLWDLKLNNDNAFVLDCPECSVNDESFIQYPDVLLLFEKLIETRKDAHLKLRYSFNVSEKPSKMFFAVETMKNGKVYLNGKDISQSKSSYFYSGLKLDAYSVSENILIGKNQVEIHTEFKQSEYIYHVMNDPGVLDTEKNKITYISELENVYLLGDFGVYADEFVEKPNCLEAKNFYIGKLNCKTDTHNLTKTGLLFFRGSVELSKTININVEPGKKYGLCFKKSCPSLNIIVNDKIVKSVLWPPYTIDITDYLVNGSNKITLELYSTNRNFFGPFHNTAGDPEFVGPSSFTDKRGWCDPLGELWQPEYSFIEFGIKII